MNSEGQATSTPIVESHAQDASTPTNVEPTTSTTTPSASNESTQAEQPVSEETANNNLESSSSESHERGSYRGRKDRNWNNKRSMGKRRNYRVYS
jgi:hypothetical protein